MAQPGYALVIYRYSTDGGTTWEGAGEDGQVDTITNLRTILYAGGAGTYTNYPVQIWTGRKWHNLGVDTADVLRHADIIKEWAAGPYPIRCWSTSLGGVYVGTEMSLTNPTERCRIASNSNKVDINVSGTTTMDLAFTPEQFGDQTTDFSPLGYARSNAAIGGSSIDLGTVSTAYSIDTTVDIAGTQLAGDTDGVYWSNGVIVDCERTYS